MTEAEMVVTPTALGQPTVPGVLAGCASNYSPGLAEAAVMNGVDHDVNNNRFMQYVDNYGCAVSPGMPFYTTLDITVTNPFIPMMDLQNLHGIIRPKTKFIGQLHKLGGGYMWQYRTFTIDGPYLVCFFPNETGTIPSEIPLDVPSFQEIDVVLPFGTDFLTATPKWVIPIGAVTGIYTLETFGCTTHCFYPSQNRIVTLAESTALGLIDPCEELRWVNILHYIKHGKLSLETMRGFANASMLHAFMIVHFNKFYIMRANSAQDLYNWITVLAGKWILFHTPLEGQVVMDGQPLVIE